MILFTSDKSGYYEMALVLLTLYSFLFSLLFSLGYLAFAHFDIFPHPYIVKGLFVILLLLGVFYLIDRNNAVSPLSIWVGWIFANMVLLNRFIKPLYKT